MADLVVHDLEDELVQRLNEEAARQNVSAEEAHRRLLRRTLLDTADDPPMTIKEYLLAMPDLGEEEEVILAGRRELPRPVDL